MEQRAARETLLLLEAEGSTSCSMNLCFAAWKIQTKKEMRSEPQADKQAGAGAAGAPQLEPEERASGGLASGLAPPHLLGFLEGRKGASGLEGEGSF